MTFLNSLGAQALEVVERYLQPKYFPQGTCIIKQGDQGDGCYLIDEGLVRIEFDTGEMDTELVLRYLEPGSIMGEFSLIDQEPRSTNAYAHTDVRARWFSTTDFNTLRRQYPEIATELLAAFCGNLIGMVRQYTQRVADLALTDEHSPAINQMVAQAVMAQKAFESWPEDRVDQLLRDVIAVMMEHAQELAERTVAESGFGVVADKVTKIRLACEGVYEMLAGQPGSGIISSDQQTGLTEVAAPMGVVLGLIPLTNPVSTIAFKTLICLKSRNALILSCHRNV
jgi:acetaldehyde dehydrogenase / alcohol dehydrogenase